MSVLLDWILLSVIVLVAFCSLLKSRLKSVQPRCRRRRSLQQPIIRKPCATCPYPPADMPFVTFAHERSMRSITQSDPPMTHCELWAFDMLICTRFISGSTDNITHRHTSGHWDKKLTISRTSDSEKMKKTLQKIYTKTCFKGVLAKWVAYTISIWHTELTRIERFVRKKLSRLTSFSVIKNGRKTTSDPHPWIHVSQRVK